MMSERGLTVKEFNPDEQPREKAEKFGCAYLTTSELWALILRTGTPGYPITQLCRDLMDSVDNSMLRLERKSRAQLRQINGIGTTKSIQIEAVMELTKRYHDEAVSGDRKPYVIKSPESIYKYMLSVNMNLNHEEIWIILLNQGNRVIARKRVSSGGSKSSVFDLKFILRAALEETGCESIVLCHNHPSGNLLPSPQDDQVTKSLREGAKTLDLRLLDHLIISNEGYYSYLDHDRL